MPPRAKRLCSSPGCTQIVSVGRCPRHELAYRARERARKVAYEQRRPSATDRGYDSAWRAVRRQFLAAHPACCEPGCNQPATEVDHIRSVREAPDLRLSWRNCRPYCKPHHSSRTGREQGGWARKNVDGQ